MLTLTQQPAEGLRMSVRWSLSRGGVILREGSNLVVDTGYLMVARRLGGVATNALTHVAWGTSGTVPAVGQVALQGTEIGRQAVTPSAAGKSLTLTATLTGPGSDQTIQEFGTFDAAAAGNMFSRFITNAFVFGPGDSLDFNWVLTFA